MGQTTSKAHFPSSQVNISIIPTEEPLLFISSKLWEESRQSGAERLKTFILLTLPSFPNVLLCPTLQPQMPNLREKSILLVKMMTYIEKRFPDELELNAQFLDLVNYVYR